MNRRSVLAQIVASGVSATAFGPTAFAGHAKAFTGPTAQTVLGPVEVSRLGFTLPHEHIADGPGFLGKWPKAWGGTAGFTKRAVEKLNLVRASGINTIVDLTTYDVGRDIRFLKEVSQQSGLNMIASTGQRFFPPQYPNVSMPARTIAGLAEFFIREIEAGVDDTGIKAGVIKIGIVGKKPSALEEIGLRAGIRASKATGVPLRIHTHAIDRAAENQTPILADEGMDPARVSFDHSDDSGEMDYFLPLVERGYSVGMDHVHRGLMPDAMPSFERRIKCIKMIIDAGFADKIFLSQDLEFGGSLLPEAVQDFRSRLDPPDGMLFTTRKLIPGLMEIGVSARDIHLMTVENPRSFFGIAD